MINTGSGTIGKYLTTQKMKVADNMHLRISGSISAVRSAVTKLAGNNPSPLHDEPFHQFRSLQNTQIQ